MQLFRDILYPDFLAGITSCTWFQLSDNEIDEQLDVLAKRAITRIKFPRISLAFDYDCEKEGYYFINDITYAEINVIIAWMMVFWIESQLGKEKHYQEVFLDKNTTGFSRANLISKIESVYTSFKENAEEEESNYYKLTTAGQISMGTING